VRRSQFILLISADRIRFNNLTCAESWYGSVQIVVYHYALPALVSNPTVDIGGARYLSDGKFSTVAKELLPSPTKQPKTFMLDDVIAIAGKRL
jgi:hypothetical protein